MRPSSSLSLASFIMVASQSGNTLAVVGFAQSLSASASKKKGSDRPVTSSGRIKRKSRFYRPRTFAFGKRLSLPLGHPGGMGGGEHGCVKAARDDIARWRKAPADIAAMARAGELQQLRMAEARDL